MARKPAILVCFDLRILTKRPRLMVVAGGVIRRSTLKEKHKCCNFLASDALLRAPPAAHI